MTDLIFGALGLHNVDMFKLRESGVSLIMDRYSFNYEQAVMIEDVAYSDCGGDMLKYIRVLTDLGELLSLMAG